MTFSAFIRHLSQSHISPTVAAQIKREAKDRITQRWQAGRADCELDFSDLAERIERAICQ